MPAKRRTPARNSADRDPPTVAQVRRIRAQMWKQAGGDVERLMSMARRTVEQSGFAKPAKKPNRRKAA
jgi:hypothetical protein